MKPINFGQNKRDCEGIYLSAVTLYVPYLDIIGGLEGSLATRRSLPSQPPRQHLESATKMVWSTYPPLELGSDMDLEVQVE